jgi:hypothetical protein
MREAVEFDSCIGQQGELMGSLIIPSNDRRAAIYLSEELDKNSLPVKSSVRRVKVIISGGTIILRLWREQLDEALVSAGSLATIHEGQRVFGPIVRRERLWISR